MAGILALLIGALLVLQFEHLNPLLIDSTDVERFSIRVLGHVPDLTPPWVDRQNKGTAWRRDLLPLNLQKPDSREALLFKQLRMRLLHFIERSEHPIKMISVTSTHRNEGKSFIAFNLALVLSKHGKRVLLIDGDVRARKLSRSLAPNAIEGLCSVTPYNHIPERFIIKDCHQKVDFLPAGQLPDDPSEFFADPLFAGLLRRCTTNYDYVFVDTPPAIEFPDAVTIAGISEATVLVGCVGRARLKDLGEVLEDLGQTAPQLWMVLNKTKSQRLIPYPSYGAGSKPVEKAS